ncbi:MAG: hypothetical protein IKM88_14860 [Lachnospiraceae bacterium]|nr:hypothetical protein [Clostridiales bacterium]MBR6851503.1 hypothetical protein [Lachnospiraceae bacterium]
MKIGGLKKSCLIVCCLLVFLSSYGVIAGDLFWNVLLFRKVSFTREIPYLFEESSELFCPRVDTDGNLLIEKPKGNTGALEIASEYNVLKKKISISSTALAFVDISNTKLYHTDDPEKKLLNEKEMLALFSDLSGTRTKIGKDLFKRERVKLSRDLYEVFYVHGDVTGEICTYSYRGTEETHRMPEIPVSWTNLKQEVFRRCFSAQALLIAVILTVIVGISAFALAKRFSNRSILGMTIVVTAAAIVSAIISMIY